MANKHYTINQEVEVTLTVKVKLQSISNYHPLSEKEIEDEIKDAKDSLEEFLKGKLKKSYQQETLTEGVDYWNFEVL